MSIGRVVPRRFEKGCFYRRRHRIIGRIALLALASEILSACVAPVHYTYHPPGAAMNPWGPYIREASQRFSIPQSWIRAIMNQESGGHQYLHGHLIRSVHGAVGLMQIKPATYEILAHRYHLGPDPYNPHDNIMAGSGYIRELYDHFGSPLFVAAYNCGPQCVENYRQHGTPLPDYARAYLAAVAPHLGDSVPMAAPNASPNTVPVEVVQTQPNAQSNMGGANTQDSIQNALQQAALIGRSADQGGKVSSPPPRYTPSYTQQPQPYNASYNVANTSGTAGVAPPMEANLPPPQGASGGMAQAPLSLTKSTITQPATVQAFSTQRTPSQSFPTTSVSMAQSLVASPSIVWKSVPGTGNVIIQIGAFSTPEHAQKVIAQARRASNVLQHAVSRIDRVMTSRGVPVWRSRLTGLPNGQGNTICSLLRQKGLTCVTVTQ